MDVPSSYINVFYTSLEQFYKSAFRRIYSHSYVLLFTTMYVKNNSQSYAAEDIKVLLAMLIL